MTAAPPLLLHPRAWWAAVDNAELVRSLAVGCVFMLVGLLVSTWERVVFFGWGMDEARARGGGWRAAVGEVFYPARDRAVRGAPVRPRPTLPEAETSQPALVGAGWTAGVGWASL
jgi:hypothetical protein